jgi:regulator of protease activity HflC (stomatin/prohibitin superfamily)
MAKYPESLDRTPPPSPRHRFWRMLGRHLPSASFALLVTMLLVVVLWPYVVITVPSGQVGVLWRRFYGFDIYCGCFAGRGTALDPRELREEGLHLIWPWNKLFLYDLRLQIATESFDAISKDGVNVTAQINVRYQLHHDSVAVIHKFIGPEYLATVISPEIGSQARQVISQYTAEEVYTSRTSIQEQIRQNAQRSLGANLNKLVQPEAMEELDPRHYTDFLQGSIQILDTLVLGIVLPPEIVAAINRQTQQFYMIQEYRFRVQREAEESQRKQIEANGIAAFQKTVSQGISDSYLRWRGIEATLALAQSNNTKIVIIGSGKDGLPIILGNVDTPAGPVPTLQSSTGETIPPSEGSPGAPPGGSSSDTTPPAPDKTPTAESAAAPANPNKEPSPSSPVDLSNIESILSRISGALHPGGSSTSSETGAKSK